MDNCKLNKNQIKFLKYVSKELKESGHKFKLEYSEKVKYSENVSCSGYYDDKLKVLAVAIKKPTLEWFEILIHEFCHFLQWKYDTYASRISSYFDTEGYDLDKWLDDKLDVDDDMNIYLFFASLFEVEFECETMTIDMINKYDLGIDISNYTKKANSYLYFYRYCREYKKWYNTPPYNIPEIVDTMPDDFTITRYFFYNANELSEQTKKLWDKVLL